MGQTQSKEGTDNLSAKDINIVKQLADSEGQIDVYKYIDEKLNKCKKEKVKLAISGRSATGKSTFINKIRNVKLGVDDSAKTGFGNTTQHPKSYMHLRNDQIAFYELPGYGTMKFKKTDYISAMKISDYDFVFILFDNVLLEDDLWLAVELRKLGKPFALVRSKIDLNIDSAIHDGKDPTKVIPEIKEEIEIDLNSSPELKSTKGIFLISSRKPDLGDWSELMVFLEVNIDGFKAEALFVSIDCITKEMLERKYKMLKKRVCTVTTLAASATFVTLSITDVAINSAVLVHEVRHYMRVFGIEPERVNTLEYFNHSLLKCKFLFEPNVDMSALIVSKLSVIELNLPLNGSVISSLVAVKVTYKFLNDILLNIKDDAMLIYEHILLTNADYRM